MQDRIIRLRSGRLGKIRPGHPWIYKRQLLKPDTFLKPGSTISVIDSNGKFIGMGYYNPRSEIAVRILSFDDEKVDSNFFKNRIRPALEKRKKLSDVTNAYRAVFSEADGLPGLIIDIYDKTAVFQVLTLGMESFKEVIVAGINEILGPEYVYEKSTSPFRRIEGLKDAAGWWGKPGSSQIEIFEGRMKFLVDIENGHKTGFYLDQRRSRMGLEGLSKDRRVLDLFCYTGAFSVSSAVFGASSVIGVDVKEAWLELARRNASLNDVFRKTEFIKADAFSYLSNMRDKAERFDLIIIDPPSFLKTRESIKSASKGYRQLNTSAMKLLNDGGILTTFSCSHNMPNEVFSGILKEAANETNKKITILKRCHQAEDHPIVKGIPETEYLKGYFIKVYSK